MYGVSKVRCKSSSHTGNNFEFAEILLAMISPNAACEHKTIHASEVVYLLLAVLLVCNQA